VPIRGGRLHPVQKPGVVPSPLAEAWAEYEQAALKFRDANAALAPLFAAIAVSRQLDAADAAEALRAGDEPDAHHERDARAKHEAAIVRRDGLARLLVEQDALLIERVREQGAQALAELAEQDERLTLQAEVVTDDLRGCLAERQAVRHAASWVEAVIDTGTALSNAVVVATVDTALDPIRRLIAS
jgi:hypothetical protein